MVINGSGRYEGVLVIDTTSKLTGPELMTTSHRASAHIFIMLALHWEIFVGKEIPN